MVSGLWSKQTHIWQTGERVWVELRGNKQAATIVALSDSLRPKPFETQNVCGRNILIQYLKEFAGFLIDFNTV